MNNSNVERSDPANLIQLPKSYHSHLHTQAYYDYVNSKLCSVDPYDTKMVYRTLAILKSEIHARAIVNSFVWD